MNTDKVETYDFKFGPWCYEILNKISDTIQIKLRDELQEPIRDAIDRKVLLMDYYRKTRLHNDFAVY